LAKSLQGKPIFKVRDLTKNPVKNKTIKALKNKKKLKSRKENQENKVNSNDNNNNESVPVLIPIPVSAPVSSIDIIKDIFDIHVRYQKRNARKIICTIAGIPSKYFTDKLKTDKFLGTLRATLATSVCINNTEKDGTVIQYAGDKIELIQHIIINFCGCELENFKIHK
jgi:translation initiation factor 1 (eIF-1/SUI1)